MVGYTENLLIT